MLKSSPVAVGGRFHGLLEVFTNRWAQFVSSSDDLKPDVVRDEALQLPVDILLEQCHQGADFGPWPLPVFLGEGVEGQHPQPHPGRRLHHIADGCRSLPGGQPHGEAPARWPMRPFPSMMTATCRGSLVKSMARAAVSSSRSRAHVFLKIDRQIVAGHECAGFRVCRSRIATNTCKQRMLSPHFRGWARRWDDSGS